MNSKQECIAKAYGEHYEELKEFIDGNGFAGLSKATDKLRRDSGFSWHFEYVNGKHCARPRSLHGIENNNGWIKIESEEDLPKDQPIDVIINSEPYQGFVYEGRSEWFCLIENRYKSKNIEDLVKANIITHYQLIEKPKSPIY